MSCLLSLIFGLGLLGADARAEAMLIGVDGMSCGVNCPDRASNALKEVQGVESALVDFDSSKACLETSGEVSADQLSTALAAVNYVLGSVDSVESCDELVEAPKVSPRDPWANTEGVDAAIISFGETFDMDAALVPEKYTIFDFGAPWCGPCHIAANLLREVMPTQPDIAVRAISLGDDAHESFELPVVAQHMGFAQSVPWFVVISPSGKKIYEGADVEVALEKIAKKRK